MIPIIAAAAVGAAAGGLSVFQRSRREQDQIRQQQRLSREAFRYQQAFSDGMFNLQRSHSLKELGIQRNRLAQAFETDVATFNMGLEGQALQNQAAQISLAGNTGLAVAQQGASGVRGSDTLQRRVDFHEGQLNRQLDLQGRGNTLFLQNMATQYSNQFNDIGREIDSWGDGGFRFEARQLSDMFAQQMHGLQMRGYRQAMDNARAGPLDYLSAILGGGASGASFGSQIDGWRNQR